MRKSNNSGRLQFLARERQYRSLNGTLFFRVALVVIVICMVIPLSLVKAQDTQLQTIRWESTGFTDVLSDTVVGIDCTFVTKPSANTVDWIQKNGAYLATFIITNTEGSWTDVGFDGSIIYSVSGNGASGRVEIARTGNSLNLTLTLNSDSGEIKNIYTLSEFFIQEP